MGYRAGTQVPPHSHVSADISDATSAPTASKVVKRDASGSFQAIGAVLASAATIAGPASAGGNINYDEGGEYQNSGDTHQIRVWAYKLVGGQRVFSSTCASAAVTDDGGGDGTYYTIDWTWSPVAGASGYVVWMNFGESEFVYWQDAGNQISLNDDSLGAWTDNGSVLAPPTPTSVSVGLSVDATGVSATGNTSLSGNVQEGSGIATGALAHAEGLQTQAIGNYSHAEGFGTIVRDAYCHGEGYQTETNLGGRVGSHVEGYQSKVRDQYAHAEGYQTDCYGTAAHTEGYKTITSNTAAHAEGQETQCWGAAGHAEGYSSKSDWTGEHSFAGGKFSAVGDAQGRRMVIRRQTSNNTQSELFIDGTFQRMGLTADSSWMFIIWLVARRADANDETKAWQIKGAIDRNTGNTTALVGTPTVEVVAGDTAANAWTVSAEADASNNALVVKVQGENGKTIRWVGVVHLVQVVG